MNSLISYFTQFAGSTLVISICGGFMKTHQLEYSDAEKSCRKLVQDELLPVSQYCGVTTKYYC